MKGAREYAVMTQAIYFDDVEGTTRGDERYMSDCAYNWRSHAQAALRIFILRNLAQWAIAGYKVFYNGGDYLRVERQYFTSEYFVKSRYC